jgi:hypothetical protein
MALIWRKSYTPIGLAYRKYYTPPACSADPGAPRTLFEFFLLWAGPVRWLCFFFFLSLFLFPLYFTLVSLFLLKFENCSDSKFGGSAFSFFVLFFFVSSLFYLVSLFFC